MKINQHAPLRYKASIIVDKRVETVWSILVDIPNWPNWNSDVTEAKLNGPLKPGTVFKWKGKGSVITSRLEVVNELQTVGWTGKTMGIKATHIYSLQEDGQRTIVTSEESWEGVLVWFAKGYLRKTLVETLEGGLSSLKLAVEK
jgi:hypothetical protein